MTEEVNTGALFYSTLITSGAGVLVFAASKFIGSIVKKAFNEKYDVLIDKVDDTNSSLDFIKKDIEKVRQENKEIIQENKNQELRLNSKMDNMFNLFVGWDVFARIADNLDILKKTGKSGEAVSGLSAVLRTEINSKK